MRALCFFLLHLHDLPHFVAIESTGAIHINLFPNLLQALFADGILRLGRQDEVH